MRANWISSLLCGVIGLTAGVANAQLTFPPAGGSTPQANGYLPPAATVKVPRTPPPAAPLYGRYPLPAPGMMQQVGYQAGNNSQFVAEPQFNAPQPRYQSAAGWQESAPAIAPHHDPGAPASPHAPQPIQQPSAPTGPAPAYDSAAMPLTNPIQGSVTGYGNPGHGRPAISAGCDSGCGPVGQNYLQEIGNDCGGSQCDSGRGDRGGRFSNLLRGSGGNFVVGLNALAFSRDYEDDYGLGFNSLGRYLFSTDADNNYFGGLEAVISRRNGCGTGFEVRYWGLYPNSATANFADTPYTNLVGLQQVYFVPNALNVLQIFNGADWHRVYRDNTFHNLELNFLRNGGCFSVGRCGNAYFELLGGFRWFQFNENFTYSAFSSNGNYPAEFNYDITTQNTLLGLQLGGRVERCLSNRLRLFTALKGGLYNNHIYHNSCMCDNTGALATIWSGPYNGTDFDLSSRKNDLAVLSEIDLGLLYQLGCRARFNLGYRIFGVSGVALAPDQIPYNFTDAQDIRRVNSNGSLLLHGAYGGFQFCF